MSKKALLALILTVCLIFTSCRIPGFSDIDLGPLFPQGGDGGDINDAPLNGSPTDWESSSGITNSVVHTTVIIDTPTDIKHLLDDGFDTDGAVWSSKCEGIATVSDGIVRGVKCGRTEIVASTPTGDSATVSVTVEFLTSSNNGYTFPTTEDKKIYKVSSEYQADRMLDRAIADHKSLIIIDFSDIGNGYNASRDYRATLELSSHVRIVKKYYENKPQVLYFEISYYRDTASEFLTATEENTYSSLANANMIIRGEQNKKNERPDDYEGFAINTENDGVAQVYNSEELWWALQNNLKPEFPIHNSKAELFYERAKMLLRDIITDDMTDFEKVLAIYDCLVNEVAYDYDAADAPSDENYHKNVCYYLEGVFERGRAVCDGKSKAFVLLCAIEGIGCVRDFGDSKTGGAGHAWNYVELNGYWYLVDTTAADASYSASSSFGRFFGAAIEFTVYDLFLTPTSSLADEYNYSGMWSDLVSGKAGDYSTGFITNAIGDTGANFLIDSKAELDLIIGTLVDADVCDASILTFTLAAGVNSNTPFYSAKSVLPSGAKYDIYTMPASGYTLYFMLISGI